MAMSLPSLEELRIHDCAALRALPENLGDVPHLNTLTLMDLPALQELPTSLCNARKLRHMRIECDNLKPPSEQHLPPNLSEESQKSLSELQPSNTALKGRNALAPQIRLASTKIAYLTC